MKLTKSAIFANFAIHGTWWGIWSGMVVGFIAMFPILLSSRMPVPSLLLAIFYDIFFALTGGIIGALAGSITGSFLAGCTLLMRQQTLTTYQFRALMLVGAAGPAFLLPFWFAGLSINWYASTRDLELVVGLFLALLTATAAAFVSQQIATWYLRREYGEKKKRYLPEELEQPAYSDMHPSLRHKLDDEEDEQRDIDADEDVRDHQHHAG